MTHLDHSGMLAALYHEGLPPALQVHLETCATCREELAQLRATLALVDDWTPDAPGAFYGAATWAKLSPKLRPRPRFLDWRIGGVAALGILLIGAFLVGRYSAPLQDPAATIRERILTAAVADHLARTQIVLREVANASPSDVDWKAEAAIASRLLDDNRVYQAASAHAADPAMSRILDELEFPLAELAHSPDAEGATFVLSLQRRIDRTDLLFRVQTYESSLRRKQQMRAGQQTTVVKGAAI